MIMLFINIDFTVQHRDNCYEAINAKTALIEAHTGAAAPRPVGEW